MTVINMDCRAGMATLPDNSVDAVVTDPPYGLSKEPNMAEVLRHWLAGDDYDHGGGGFMGKSWDSFVPGPVTWREALRVLKPGGHALIFAGARTQDLMSISLRLAGFEIRDCARYLYEDEEPQTLEEAKAAAQTGGGAAWVYGSGFPKSLNVSKKISGRDGYGTALKPAYEPIIIARKPLDGTVVKTLLKYGTGALNIGGCRISRQADDRTEYGVDGDESSFAGNGITSGYRERVAYTAHDQGRWPANMLHDGLTEVWARYFYCAKASKADRNAGLEGFSVKQPHEITGRKEGSAGQDNPRASTRTGTRANYHPTVKPTELMRWCCRLVGHPGAIILDPFAGSGSTGRGAVLEGFKFIGFQWDPDDPKGRMVDIANARIKHALQQGNEDNDQ